MERPRCDFEACKTPSVGFHSARGLFSCASHVTEWSKEARFVMTVMSRVCAPLCRMGCGRQAVYRSTRGGADFFCAIHSEGIPQQWLSSQLGEAQVENMVEISLGSKEGDYNLVPLIETANSLGRRGCAVTNLTWRDNDPSSRRVRLHLAPFDNSAWLDPQTKMQIALLESSYQNAKDEANALREAHKSKDNLYLREQADNQLLRGSIQALKEELEQATLRHQVLLADGREGERRSLPDLEFDMGEYR